ncbi:MAG: 1-acyl-sn-glycerol-3-phosphate acyltransferase, partial [Comamonadaceae bacterium CG_4_10_14_0_8_um_filter_57_29]
MAWMRSVLHMVWIVLTVVPWTLAVLLVSLVPPRTYAWWTAVNWFRVVMWGTRVILGVRFKVLGYEHLPIGKTSA